MVESKNWNFTISCAERMGFRCFVCSSILISFALYGCSSEFGGEDHTIVFADSLLKNIVSAKGIELDSDGYEILYNACEPELTVNGSAASMTLRSGTWSASVSNFTPDSYSTVSMTWVCDVGEFGYASGRTLEVAGLTRQVWVEEGESNVASFASEEFEDQGFDVDGDGYSNLSELLWAYKNDGSNPDSNPFFDTYGFPDLAGIAQRSTRTITIDGNIDDWNLSQDFSGFLGYVDRLMFTEEGRHDLNNGEPFSYVFARHNGSYLYLLVVFDDASGTWWRDSTNHHDDDNFNIYLDGGYDHGSSYDKVDDYNLKIPVYAQGYDTNHNLEFSYGINSAQNVGGSISYSVGFGGLPSNYNTNYSGSLPILEFRIPLSRIDVSVGGVFGLEVEIDDDDNGGDRDSKWGMFHPAGNASDIAGGDESNDLAYQNPQYMRAIGIAY